MYDEKDQNLEKTIYVSQYDIICDTDMNFPTYKGYSSLPYPKPYLTHALTNGLLDLSHT